MRLLGFKTVSFLLVSVPLGRGDIDHESWNPSKGAVLPDPPTGHGFHKTLYLKMSGTFLHLFGLRGTIRAFPS